MDTIRRSHSRSAKHEHLAGTKLGRYEVRSKLGEGGMGVVYLADDTTLHRRVAIKFFSVAAAKDERAGERLLREAQSAAKLATTPIKCHWKRLRESSLESTPTPASAPAAR